MDCNDKLSTSDKMEMFIDYKIEELSAKITFARKLFYFEVPIICFASHHIFVSGCLYVLLHCYHSECMCATVPIYIWVCMVRAPEYIFV
jgi:hypothetical protein